MTVSRPDGCAGISRTTGIASPVDATAQEAVDDDELLASQAPYFVGGQLLGRRVHHARSGLFRLVSSSRRDASHRDGPDDGARSSIRWPRVAIRYDLELLGSLPVGRGRMPGIKREQILGLLGLLLALPWCSRVVDAEQPVAHGRIDGVAGGLVVVMREVEDLGTDAIGRADQRVDAADRGKGAAPSSSGGPVAGGADEDQGARGAHSAANSTLSVPCRRPAAFSQTQPPWKVSETITTGAETLMRSSRAVSRKVWVPPPDSPVQPIRVDIDVRQRGQPVERPDAVPGLERGQAQAPAPQAVVQEHVRERLAVVVADHVVQEDDAAELRPANAALLDLGIDPAVLPVAVRAEDARHLAGRVDRPVEVAAEREAREGFEHDLLDRVAVARELAVDLGFIGVLGNIGQRPRVTSICSRRCRARSRQAAADAGAWKSRPLVVGPHLGPAAVRRWLDRVDPPADQVQVGSSAWIGAGG